MGIKIYPQFFTILTAYLLLLGFDGLAQSKKTVSGRILDFDTKRPVDFATVALQDKVGKILDGVVCHTLGKFTFKQVSSGDYTLSISFIGYKTKAHPFAISGKIGEVVLGDIELSADNKSLDEVVVRAVKPMVEETDDGFVYNAENDINASGGTASDLLKNVPGVSVDMDGNLEMQGSTKIKILIDGKPSAIMAGNIAEALQQIPANMIEKVEVITTPSAKYAAEGAGGVINIITKKSTSLEGYKGGITITGGNRANSVNGNFTTRIGKLGLRSSVGGNLNRNFGNGESEQIYYAQRQVLQTSEFRNDGQGLNGLLGGDFDFNDKNSLTGTLRFGKYHAINDRQNNSLVTSTIPENFGNIISNDRNNTDSKSASGSVDSNLDYTHKFKTKGQELNVLMLYSRNNRDGDNYTVRQNKDGVINQRLQNNNDASVREVTFQADYVQPLKKWGKLELGGKAILRNNGSNYQLASASSSEGALVIDTRRTNIFTYDQDVYSAYLSYNFQLKKKFNFRFGGRYEYTNIFANFVSNDTTLRKPYPALMPNVTISARLKKEQRISINYSTQIFRPQIEYLNPYLDDSNERSIRVGNPNLLPELTHNLQLTYSKYLKTLSINGSVYWRQTNDDIGQYRTWNRVRSRTADNDSNIANDSIDAITTTYLNLGSNLTYGTNISVSGRIRKLVQLGGNFSFFYNEINGFVYSSQLKKGVTLSRGGWMYSVKLNAGFQVPKTLKGPFKDVSGQITSSISSPRLTLQGKTSSLQQYNISLKKDFMVRQVSKDRVSLNFSIENFFSKGNRIRTTTITEQFGSTSIQNYYNRVFRVGLTYNFSRMEYKIKPEKEQKNHENDDRRKIDNGEVKDIKFEGGDNGKNAGRKSAPAPKKN